MVVVMFMVMSLVSVCAFWLGIFSERRRMNKIPELKVVPFDFERYGDEQ